MENYPLVSIIIPTYNRSKLLSRSVKYAFLQNYPNYEVIVSNNASSDNSTEILCNLQQEYPELKVINHSSLLPLNVHWDTVIRDYSKGIYLIIISDDDLIFDSFYISKAVNLFLTFKSIGIVFANYKNVDVGNNELTVIKALFSNFIDKKYMYENFNKKIFGINGLGIPLLTAIFSREAYLKTGGFDITCFCLDTYLWLKIMLFYDLGFVKDCVAEYMIHTNNISKTANLNLFYSDTKIVDAIKPWAKKSDIPPQIISNTLKRMESKFLQGYFNSVKKNVKTNFLKTIFKIKWLTVLRFLFKKNYYKCENL